MEIVLHQHRHHAVVLPELIYYFARLLDRSTGIVIELNVCRTRRCRVFGTWIGRIVKTYDYINRVNKRFRLAIFKGMKIHSPSHCYASPR